MRQANKRQYKLTQIRKNQTKVKSFAREMKVKTKKSYHGLS
jgi:hypothetical protein